MAPGLQRHIRPPAAWCTEGPRRTARQLDRDRRERVPGRSRALRRVQREARTCATRTARAWSRASPASATSSGTAIDGDQLVPAPGQLLYRGIEITDLVERLRLRGPARLRGDGLPAALRRAARTASELEEFEEYLAEMRRMPRSFIHDGILRMPSRDMMNAMMRGVLGLYTLDPQAERHFHPQPPAPEPAPHREVPDARGLRVPGLPRRVPRQEPGHPSPEPRVLHRRELPPHASPQQQVHRSRGARARHDARAARRARRRQQLVVHDARRVLHGHRHVLGDRRVARLAQGPPARRREPQGRGDVRRPARERHRLGGRRADRRLPAPPARQGGVRPQRPRLRDGASGLLGLRSRGRSSCAATPSSSPTRRATPRSSRSTRASSGSHRSSSRRSAGSTKASAPTSTSTPASSTGCSTSPPSSTRRCSRSRASWAGARTGSRSSPTAARSSARRTRASRRPSRTCRSRSGSPGVAARQATGPDLAPSRPEERHHARLRPRHRHVAVRRRHAAETTSTAT